MSYLSKHFNGTTDSVVAFQWGIFFIVEHKNYKIISTFGNMSKVLNNGLN